MSQQMNQQTMNMEDHAIFEPTINQNVMSRNSSDASTVLLEEDMIDESSDEEMASSIQSPDVDSTTSSPSYLLRNQYSVMGNWQRKPALTAFYDTQHDFSSMHNNKILNSFPKFNNLYDNALLTCKYNNTCITDKSIVCPMKKIQYIVDTTTENWSKHTKSIAFRDNTDNNITRTRVQDQNGGQLTQEDTEEAKENMLYIHKLITDMEAGVQAMQQWQLIINSMRHWEHRNQFPLQSGNRNLEKTVQAALRSESKPPCLTLSEQLPIMVSQDVRKSLANHHQSDIEAMEAQRLIQSIQTYMQYHKNEWM